MVSLGSGQRDVTPGDKPGASFIHRRGVIGSRQRDVPPDKPGASFILRRGKSGSGQRDVPPNKPGASFILRRGKSGSGQRDVPPNKPGASFILRRGKSGSGQRDVPPGTSRGHLFIHRRGTAPSTAQSVRNLPTMSIILSTRAMSIGLDQWPSTLKAEPTIKPSASL